jgi:hypothetical protein
LSYRGCFAALADLIVVVCCTDSLLQKLMLHPDTLELFHAIDTDGNGTIDLDELRQGFGMIGEECSETELAMVMELVDSDGGGTIEYEEFARVGNIAKDLKALANSVAQEVQRERPIHHNVIQMVRFGMIKRCLCAADVCCESEQGGYAGAAGEDGRR